MSHPVGKYVGGIKSVECLRQRSRIDPDTGCWHWGLSLNEGAPSLHAYHPVTGKTIKMRGRRAALLLSAGCDLPAGHRAFAVDSCKSPDCVNPAHSRSGTRRQFGLWLSRSGIHKNLDTKYAAARKAWDTRGRKISPEMVAEIRSSADSVMKVAKRLGLSQYAVWSVRAGKSHRHIATVSSVFVLATGG